MKSLIPYFPKRGFSTSELIRELIITLEKNDLYFIKMDIGGREYESYVNKDGSYLFPSGFDLNKELPKTQESFVIQVPLFEVPSFPFAEASPATEP